MPSNSRINTIFLSNFCKSQVQHKPNFSFLGEFQELFLGDPNFDIFTFVKLDH